MFFGYFLPKARSEQAKCYLFSFSSKKSQKIAGYDVWLIYRKTKLFVKQVLKLIDIYIEKKKKTLCGLISFLSSNQCWSNGIFERILFFFYSFSTTHCWQCAIKSFVFIKEMKWWKNTEKSITPNWSFGLSVFFFILSLFFLQFYLHYAIVCCLKTGKAHNSYDQSALINLIFTKRTLWEI